MALPSSSNDPLKYLNGLRKPESMQQSQYRGVNSNSNGGTRGAADPSVMPRVTGSTSMKPRGFGDYMAQTNPTLARRSASQPYPGMVGYQGPSANDNAWADRVNGMGQGQLNSLLDAGSQVFRNRQSPANVARSFSYKPGSISVSPGALGQVQALSNTPQQRSGFSMNGPQQVQASVPPMANGNYVTPATEQAFRSFGSSVPQPVNTGKIISDRIAENMQNASAQGRQDANSTVDQNLNARMGFYSTPQARRGGFFQRGMGPMDGDAAIVQNQNRPLGDGGPAAYAARSDQENRRRSAEAAMGGVAPDGLTRYTPNNDVLAFANKDRAAEDQRMSDFLGGGTTARQPMQAMTPSEIQFYRHKLNMASNPQYKERVMQQRMDRQEMLDNRREMVRARRAGALEAAGASQQLRNLQAGRGAVAGQDGFNALMSSAAQQNPNQAFDSFGQAAMANNAPGMLRDRLRAEENMLGTRANIDRMQQYENMRMQIITSGMPDMEKQRALQSLNNSILMGGGFGAVQGPGAQGGVGAYVPPSGVPLPDAFPSDPSIPTVQRMAEYMQALRANPQFQALPPEQQQQFIDNVQSQYFGGVRRSDREQYGQDNIRNPLTNLWNFGMSMFGLDPASQTRRQEAMDAIDPYQPSGDGLTPDEVKAIQQMPDSRDRQLYERFLREGR